MSTRSYSIVEPHPNPSSTHYISTGRGGAGNTIRASSQNITSGADATGPAAAAAIRSSLASSKPASTTSSTPRKSMSGRGGAGNAFPASERAIFSFDEELERQLRWESVAPVYHVGRGGAGNLIHATPSTASAQAQKNFNVRRMSDDSGASVQSFSSRESESGADVFNRGVKKGWKKIVGGY